jgi:hypothetical protein
MGNLTVKIRDWLDASDVSIDWSQSVEIVEHGTFHDEWTLRDPDTHITATGESYLEARRNLTRYRESNQRIKRVIQRCIKKGTRDVERQLGRSGGVSR